MAEQSARCPCGLPWWDAPLARAASLASSAALPRPPDDGLTWPSSEAADPHGNPPVIPPGIPPAADGGGSLSRLTGIGPGQTPFGGPVGRKERGRLAPLGAVVRPRRKVRFARLIHAARPRSWRTFGPRRLRRQSEPALIATQGGTG
jgi:hypothetical protein